MAGTKTDRLGVVAARNIRAWRQRRALTQEEVASRSRIDYKRFQRIEAGQINLTLRTLERIARVLRVDSLALFRA